jgi:NADPH:quinone reductase-like Zn-dependent oxidoreductase
VSPADCAARKGDPFIIRLFTGLTRPKQSARILGAEFAGEVEALGKDVTLFQPGDLVYGGTGATYGAYAEYICIAENGAVAIRPSSLSHPEAAALCEGVLTALPFLRDHGQIKPGDKVLINGASGCVGAAGVQLAKHYGAEVTGVCSFRNVDLVRSLGADQVIDYTREDFTQNGQTYDIVFDAVGKSSFSRCRNSLKKGGFYLTTVPSLAIVLQMAWTKLFGGKKAILATTGLRSTDKKANDLIYLHELVKSGEIRPVIDRCYPPEQMVDAHRYVETERKRGNVVLIWNHDGRHATYDEDAAVRLTQQV